MKNSRTNIVIFRIKSICRYKNNIIELYKLSSEGRSSYRVRSVTPASTRPKTTQ